jgi:hypothetical protein
VRARAQVRGEVQQPRHHVAVQKHLRQHQRRSGEHIEKDGHQEEGQVLQALHLDSPDPLDPLVKLDLHRIGGLG